MMAAVMLAGTSLAADAPGSLVPGAAVAKACENGSRQLKCEILGFKARRLLIANNAKDRPEDVECHEKKGGGAEGVVKRRLCGRDYCWLCYWSLIKVAAAWGLHKMLSVDY